jgi:hypothetical protein
MKLDGTYTKFYLWNLKMVRIISWCIKLINSQKMPGTANPLHFKFLFPSNKVWLTPKEVGAAIGRTDQFVRNSISNGKIFAHKNNASAKSGREIRYTYQIHRHAVFLYLASTSNYTLCEK